MSPFPVLNNRPIDQWKVTELKEELKRRKLPVRGLKDELVRRLDEALRQEASKKDEGNPGIDDDDVEAAASGEVVGGDSHLVSDLPEDVALEKSEPHGIPVATEADELPKDGVHVESDIAATTEIVSTGGADADLLDNTVQDKLHPQEVVAEPVAGELPENDYEAPNASVEGNAVILEEDIHMGENKTEDKIEPGTEYAADADVIMKEDNSFDTSPAVEDAVKDRVSVHDEENGDCKLTSTPVISESNIQVLEGTPDLGSQIKSKSISDTDILFNEQNELKDNLNADNFRLELEGKPEVVQQTLSISALAVETNPLDDDKELVKDQSSLDEIGYPTQAEGSSKKDSNADDSPEKLNLDRSSGDESMEEDPVESKPVDVRAAEPEEETAFNKGDMMETLDDTVVEDRSADTKNVVAEEKARTAALSEKRKFEDKEAIPSDDGNKRQRRFGADNTKLPERLRPNHSGTAADSPKNAFQPALKRSFGRADPKQAEETPKERTVPPTQKAATTSLRIDNFLRPFTLKAVQELLGKNGSVGSFWMDHIKTHCYVTYSSVEEAVATRNALYNLQWPPNGGKLLTAEFVDPQEVTQKLEAPPVSAVPTTPSPAVTPRTPFQQAQSGPTQPPRQNVPREELPPPPPLPKPLVLGVPPVKERLPPPPPLPKKLEPAVLTLDDLFRKTSATPRIYYLPLSEEQVAAKLAAQGQGKRE